MLLNMILTNEEEETLMRDVRYKFFADYFPFAAKWDSQFIDGNQTSHLPPDVQAAFRQYVENLDWAAWYFDFIHKKIDFICCHILNVTSVEIENFENFENKNFIFNAVNLEKENSLLIKLNDFFAKHDLLQKFDNFWRDNGKNFDNREHAAICFLLESEPFNTLWIDYANLY